MVLLATCLGWEDMNEEEEEDEEDEEEPEVAEEQPAAKPQRDVRHRPDATRILTTEDFQLIGDSTRLDSTRLVSSHPDLQSNVLPVLVIYVGRVIFSF
jgi:hypothetical protein